MARRYTDPSRRASSQEARRAFSVRFIGESLSELRRVTWPTRQETMRLTLMVISVAATVGLLLAIVDMVFARVFSVLLGS